MAERTWLWQSAIHQVNKNGLFHNRNHSKIVHSYRGLIHQHQDRVDSSYFPFMHSPFCTRAKGSRGLGYKRPRFNLTVVTKCSLSVLEKQRLFTKEKFASSNCQVKL